MPLNSKFFLSIRSPITIETGKSITLYDSLPQTAVDGFNALAAEWERLKVPDIDILAYLMATAYRECGPGINLSIVEVGRGTGKKYGVPAGPYNLIYYGRGPDQCTWYDNYFKMEKRQNVPFTKSPDLMLIPKYNVPVMFDGCLNGIWTGVGLRHYITPGVKTSRANLVGARHVVNGTDHAEEIADNALAFRVALTAGIDPPHIIVPATVTVPPTSQATQPPRRGLIAEFLRLFQKGPK